MISLQRFSITLKKTKDSFCKSLKAHSSGCAFSYGKRAPKSCTACAEDIWASLTHVS